MSRIQLPARKKLTAKSYSKSLFLDSEEMKINVVERSFEEIRDLIDKIHNKYQDELEEGNHPNYLVINKLDYDFLNAYFNQYFPYSTFVEIDKLEQRKLKAIFGMKLILTSSNLFRIGWEP